MPLAWFAAFDDAIPAPPRPDAPPPAITWDWLTTADEHTAAVARIRAAIAAGWTYQTNYTVRLRSSDPVDPEAGPAFGTRSCYATDGDLEKSE